ncbi:MAG: hypothetical protein JSW60_08795 [Thermoplasmatales archaeon]|nr:MAG: hypothetical protein JSW60_08795 [Thermoplasmatales archaeon]
MKKKILIGSIMAFAILIGVSFTSVVGFQSVKSDVKASPLFTVRSKRAIDEESKDLTCDYIGKRTPTLLPIPKRDSRIEMVQEFIDSIQKMDNKAFNRFVNFLINRQGKGIKEENIPEMINILYQLKINPGEIKNYIADEKENKPYTSACETLGWPNITPECLLLLLWLIITLPIWESLLFATIILDCL